MSFALHIWPFQNGERSEFDRSLFLKIFGPESGLERNNFGEIEFPDGSGAQEIYGVDEKVITSIMFTRFGGYQFFDAVWRLADTTNSLIAWPGSKGNFAVTSTDTFAHTPADLHALQTPIKVVNNAQELIDYIREQRS